MKLTKKLLKDIIIETLSETNMQSTAKKDLQSDIRSRTAATAASGAGKLTQIEVDVVAELRKIVQALELPGTQITATAKNYVIKLRDEIAKITKN